MSQSPRDLHTLIFVSRARPDFSHTDIDLMVSSSRARNVRRDITALCVYHQGVFLQVMEGPRPQIQTLYEKCILHDSRHADVTLVHHESIRRRQFKNSAMMFCALDEWTDESGTINDSFLQGEQPLFALREDAPRALALVRQIYDRAASGS